MGQDRTNLPGEQGYVHPDPVMDAALSWFFLLQGAPEDPRLRLEFEQWQADHSDNRSRFEEVAAAWAVPEADEVARTLAQRAAHEQAANVVELRRPKRVAMRWAAAVAAMMLIAVGIQQYPALALRWAADYVTLAGVQRTVMLPDGSRVVMNTDSAIALDFVGQTRSVRLLKGEAYFDVVHDASRPFDVAAGFSQVEVKGTAFSVRTDDDQDTVALERGHVEVRRLSEPSDKAELHPGQGLVATATAMSSVRPIVGSVTFAWLNGQMAFEDQSFKSVLQDLSRYYGHTVISVSSAFDDVKVNGRYRLDNPERAIRSLATTVGASVTRVPGGILILR